MLFLLGNKVKNRDSGLHVRDILALSSVNNALTIDVEDYFHTEAASSAVSRDQWAEQPSRVESSTFALLEQIGRAHV